MFRHETHDLYDYLEREREPGKSDMTDERAAEIRNHLASCSRCRAEALEIGRLLDARPAFGTSPSARLSGGYWSAYADRADAKVAAASRGENGFEPAGISPLRELIDRITITLQALSRPVAFAGAGLAVVAAFAIIRFVAVDGADGPPTAGVGAGSGGGAGTDGRGESDGATIAARRALDEYFRKSNMLLVGVANAEPGESAEFGATIQASRTLLDRGRNLREVPMDHYSSRLMGDLDRIMVELANYKDAGEDAGNDAGNDAIGAEYVRLIQKGIEKENLLFKLRMREERYGDPNVMAANYNPDELNGDGAGDRNGTGGYNDNQRGDTLERN